MLEHQRYLIKEHVAFMKVTDTYDIFNPDDGEKLGVAKENISGFKKFMRWIISKHLMSTRIDVRDAEGDLVFTIRKPFKFFRSRVEVYDAEDEMVGYFKGKIFSIGGGFWVYDKKDQHFAEIKGDWKSWNFQFLTSDGQKLGIVTKKWAGLGKELFTSADNYIVSIEDDLADQPVAKMLLLAAALAVDIVMKEANG